MSDHDMSVCEEKISDGINIYHSNERDSSKWKIYIVFFVLNATLVAHCYTLRINNLPLTCEIGALQATDLYNIYIYTNCEDRIGIGQYRNLA